MRSEAPALRPVELLQLAGHPLRWDLLQGLARSDHTVRELTRLVDEPQNLVSYHLGKLRKASLVSARRSSADGRDTYYRADLPRVAALLRGVGSSLHPGLGESAPTSAPMAPDGRRPRVLFLCTGNSARSQMAEALVQHRSDGQVEACSAGSRPKPLHPNAVRVMRDEFGIDLSGRASTHLDDVADQHFDLVVTLCDRVREVCPELPGRPDAVHWSMPDPSEGQPPEDLEASYPSFQDTAAEIAVRIELLLAVLTPSAHVPSTPREEP